MSRDWDKLHRQERAQKPDLHHFPRKKYSTRWRGSKRRFQKRASFAANGARVKFQARAAAPVNPVLTKPSQTPTILKILRVEMPGGIAWALFQRKKGRWSVLNTTSELPWLIRVRHISVIEDWIRNNHFPFQWLNATPELRNQIFAQGSSDEHPAPSKKASSASLS